MFHIKLYAIIHDNLAQKTRVCCQYVTQMIIRTVEVFYLCKWNVENMAFEWTVSGKKLNYCPDSEQLGLDRAKNKQIKLLNPSVIYRRWRCESLQCFGDINVALLRKVIFIFQLWCQLFAQSAEQLTVCVKSKMDGKRSQIEINVNDTLFSSVI